LEYELVSVTFSPLQIAVDPLAEMVGADGIGLTVTDVEADVAEHVPSDTVTV
jgi:hypothetical protein